MIQPLPWEDRVPKARNDMVPLHLGLSNVLVLVHYPRATHCGGDIVTLLWFRPSVRGSVRPCVDLVNTIETTP